RPASSSLSAWIVATATAVSTSAVVTRMVPARVSTAKGLAASPDSWARSVRVDSAGGGGGQGKASRGVKARRPGTVTSFVTARTAADRVRLQCFSGLAPGPDHVPLWRQGRQPEGVAGHEGQGVLVRRGKQGRRGAGFNDSNVLDLIALSSRPARPP